MRFCLIPVADNSMLEGRSPPSPPLLPALSLFLLPLVENLTGMCLIVGVTVMFDPVEYSVVEGQSVRMRIVLSMAMDHDITVQLNFQDITTSGITQMKKEHAVLY